ncbi:cobalamin/Fe3+-siderophore ABC transporter ATP-binding protein, partial [Vibrio vulnificus]
MAGLPQQDKQAKNPDELSKEKRMSTEANSHSASQAGPTLAAEGISLAYGERTVVDGL